MTCMSAYTKASKFGLQVSFQSLYRVHWSRASAEGPSADGATSREYGGMPPQKILKCNFLHFGGRFYRILMVRKRHITCKNLQFV